MLLHIIIKMLSCKEQVAYFQVFDAKIWLLNRAVLAAKEWCWVIKSHFVNVVALLS